MALLHNTSPHSHSPLSTRLIMLEVLLAAVPGTIVLSSFFGYGIWINVFFGLFFALALEAMILWFRGTAIRLFLFDGSALVTALLLAIALPPTAPWWILLTGMVCAIVVAKHLYGGLGQNPFNPAMVGYVVLLIAFPVEMTRWLPPLTLADDTLLHSVSGALMNFLGYGAQLSQDKGMDAYTAATALDALKTARNMGLTPEEAAARFGTLSYSEQGLTATGWFWSNLAFCFGGFYLLWRKHITWHIPISFLATLAVCAVIGAIFNPVYGGATFHLFSGASMVGAFFIATDPVSAATSKQGKLIYGMGIGFLTYLIRTLGGFPDAVAFAVLLMNICTPSIDYFTRPRTYGHKRTKKGWRHS